MAYNYREGCRCDPVVFGCGGESGRCYIAKVPDGVQFKRQVIGGRGVTLVRFYAPRSCICRDRDAMFRRFARDYRGKVWFFDVDTDLLPDLVEQYAVELIPTVVFFVNGVESERLVGLHSHDQYEALLGRLSERTVGDEDSMNGRTDLVTFKGDPLTLLGGEVRVGDAAPDFTALTADLSEVRLSDFRGKVVLIVAVPSVDTPVCDVEVRRFNEEAARFGEEVKVLVVSMDLPFAQRRWCGVSGIENVQTLSDHRDGSFGRSYGVLIKDLRLLARSVWLVDREGKLRYVELVKEITNEPDYDAALKAVRELVKQ